MPKTKEFLLVVDFDGQHDVARLGQGYTVLEAENYAEGQVSNFQIGEKHREAASEYYERSGPEGLYLEVANLLSSNAAEFEQSMRGRVPKSQVFGQLQEVVKELGERQQQVQQPRGQLTQDLALWTERFREPPLNPDGPLSELFARSTVNVKTVSWHLKDEARSCRTHYENHPEAQKHADTIWLGDQLMKGAEYHQDPERSCDTQLPDLQRIHGDAFEWSDMSRGQLSSRDIALSETLDEIYYELLDPQASYGALPSAFENHDRVALIVTAPEYVNAGLQRSVPELVNAGIQVKLVGYGSPDDLPREAALTLDKMMRTASLDQIDRRDTHDAIGRDAVETVAPATRGSPVEGSSASTKANDVSDNHEPGKGLDASGPAR